MNRYFERFICFPSSCDSVFSLRQYVPTDAGRTKPSNYSSTYEHTYRRVRPALMRLSKLQRPAPNPSLRKRKGSWTAHTCSNFFFSNVIGGRILKVNATLSFRIFSRINLDNALFIGNHSTSINARVYSRVNHQLEV